MTKKIDNASCSFLSSDSERDNGTTIKNPEKNFIETNYRLKFGSHSSSSDDDKDEKLPNSNKTKMNYFQLKNEKENRYWKRRREEREKLSEKGIRSIWGYSPTHEELKQLFAECEANEKSSKNELKNGEKLSSKQKKHKNISSDSDNQSTSSSSSNHKTKRKNKKKKKHKKHLYSTNKKEKKSKNKKKRKRSVASSSESLSASLDSETSEIGKKQKKKKRLEKSKKRDEKKKSDDEWIELTKELREEEAKRTKEEEALIIGPQIPEHLLEKTNSLMYENQLTSKDRKNMLRGEAAAMAAYAAQGKRIPRRGEIGLSSSEISEFEKVGYVMSGTRHKSMEATRLRKEDQILTAEEKRLLNSLSQDQRQKKEQTVLNQFRDLIASKNAKN